jgi:hypothetical protein
MLSGLPLKGVTSAIQRGTGFLGGVPVNFRELAVKVAGEAARSASPIPGTGAVTDALLREVLNVQDEQVVRLERIEGDVARLVDGPWQTGTRYLREAALPNRTGDQIRKALEQAKDYFTEAADAQPARSMKRSTVLLDLALVCMLLGDKELCSFYAQQAGLEAQRAVEQAADMAWRRYRRSWFGPKDEEKLVVALRELHGQFEDVRAPAMVLGTNLAGLQPDLIGGRNELAKDVAEHREAIVRTAIE